MATPKSVATWDEEMMEEETVSIGGREVNRGTARGSNGHYTNWHEE